MQDVKKRNHGRRAFSLNRSLLYIGGGFALFSLICLSGQAKAAGAMAPEGPADVKAASSTEATDKGKAADSTDTAKPNTTDTTADPVPVAPTPAPEKKAPAIHNLLTIGADLFFGINNTNGIRTRNNDAVWAGYGTAFPSLVSVNWRRNEAEGLHVSVGIGDMYSGGGTVLRQPVEAFYQLPAGKGGTLTLGKFYVPFATQEWEYEPKYGMMFQTSQGKMSYAASLNYNVNRDNPNAYLHIARQLTPRTSMGVSAGMGRGLFFDSSHGAALGLDMNHDFGWAQFTTEYDLAPGPNGPFQFVYGKLTMTKCGRFQPYVGAYYWHDQAQELGQFHSYLVGMGYKVTSNLSLDGGLALANDKNVFWFQSHVSY